MLVLAIDGGGVRGAIPAGVLGLWESETSKHVHADLYAGTSTGAIIAGALAIGLHASDVAKLFQQHTGAIFTKAEGSFAKRALSFKGWALPAYTHDELKNVLESTLGDTTLGAVAKPLCITSLDVVTGRPRVFRSHHLPNSVSDKGLRITDVILASAAAPGFFPSQTLEGSSFVDGALWANNPSLLAAIEASALSGKPAFADLKVLSLGCGRPVWGKDVGYGLQRGLVGWGAGLVPLVMSAQSDGVHDYMSRLMPDGGYARIDPPLPKDLSALDDADNVPALFARGAQAARDNFPLLNKFLG